MSSFGDRLKQERVSRGVSLDEISGATGVDRVYLEALEENRFELLTGPAFGKLYIRAYAAVLGFDPTPLIEDYDQELQSRRREEAEAATDRVRPAARGSETDGNGAKPSGRGQTGASQVPGAARVPDAPLPEPEASPPVIPVAPDREGPGLGEGAEESQKLDPSEGRGKGRAWRPGSLSSLVLTATVSLAAVLLVAWGVRALLGKGGGETRVAATAAGAEETASASASPPKTRAAEPDGEPEPAARPGWAEPPDPTAGAGAERNPPPTRAAGTGGTLDVPEFGVGLRVVNRRLEGEGESFEEGTAVFFLTRVVGGAAGESVRHVWIRGEGEVQTIELRLGGPHWRTYSSKTLHGLGPWSVEARDAEGRVLARVPFTCVPAGS